MKTLFLFLLTVSIGASLRLQQRTFPNFYKLNFIIDPNEDTFSGTVEINVDITPLSYENNVTQLEFHSNTNFIQIETINLDGNETICQNSDYQDEIVYLECSKDITGSNRTIFVSFKSNFTTEDLFGIYKTQYKDNEVSKTAIVTNFKHTHARRVFPCLDEPGLKATFDISITHPKSYTALSNTKYKKVTTSGNNTVTVFETTPKMSTYLVSLLISELSGNGESSETEDYVLRIYTRAEMKSFTTNVIKYTPKILDMMGEWTGVKYEDLGNGKINLIAVPDFVEEPQNSWGVLAFNEADLIDEGSLTRNEDKQRIIVTLARELSSQWFGSYVTPYWWSDAWLSVGFSTYFSYKLAEQVTDSEFNLQEQFLINVLQVALSADMELYSNQELSSNVQSVTFTGQIDDKFGDISHLKGASILRMLEFVLGQENFKTGVQKYFKTFQYDNTKTSDLLTILQEFAPNDVNLTLYFNPYIYQTGFPVIKVYINDTDVNHLQTLIEVEGTLTDDGLVDDRIWYVPLTFTRSSVVNFDQINVTKWLKSGDKYTLYLYNQEWIVANLNSYGFYRVNYDTTLWSRLINSLKDDSQRYNIPVLTRAQLIDDVFNLARVDLVDYEIAFSLAEYLVSETEYYPWYSAIKAFEYILERIEDEETLTKLKATILGYMENVLEIPDSLEMNNTLSHLDVLKQNLLLDFACKLGHTDCVQFVSDQFIKYKTNITALENRNLRDWLLCNGFRNTDEPEFDYGAVYPQFGRSKSPIERNAIINNIACINDQDVLYDYLDYSIEDKNNVHNEDLLVILKAVACRNIIGAEVAMDFLSNRSSLISDSYKDLIATDDIVVELAKKLTVEEDFKKLQKFAAENMDPIMFPIIQSQVSLITNSTVNWIKSHGDELKNILVYGGTSVTVPEGTTASSTIQTSTEKSGAFVYSGPSLVAILMLSFCLGLVEL